MLGKEGKEQAFTNILFARMLALEVFIMFTRTTNENVFESAYCKSRVVILILFRF